MLAAQERGCPLQQQQQQQQTVGLAAVQHRANTTSTTLGGTSKSGGEGIKGQLTLLWVEQVRIRGLGKIHQVLALPLHRAFRRDVGAGCTSDPRPSDMNTIALHCLTPCPSAVAVPAVRLSIEGEALQESNVRLEPSPQ